MRQSTLFGKTKRENPRDEESQNAILLIRAGFIDKLGAGIYSFLPLGLLVLRKIENIVREEIKAIGGQEILMPALHPKENWEKTNRWAHFDALFKLKGYGEKDYALGATHEEIVSPLATKFVFSYKDLPFYLFQIQTKFRNEPRAKSGLLRCREFLMKDLYSFHTDNADLDNYYEKVIIAYKNIFKKCGLEKNTYLTLASGGSFSKYSHEFQTISQAGEDTIYICQKCHLAINKEIKEENPFCPQCQGKDFKETSAIEVGNIFKLGTKYSAPFDLKYKDEKGEEKTVIMGCYGLGPTRLIGAVAEIFHDDRGLIWPENIAPFKYHLLVLGENEKIQKEADKFYEKMIALGQKVLYDDRKISIGEKFADADLIGLPYRLVISEKTLQQKSLEIKKRHEQKTELIKLNRAINKLK